MMKILTITFQCVGNVAKSFVLAMSTLVLIQFLNSTNIVLKSSSHSRPAQMVSRSTVDMYDSYGFTVEALNFTLLPKNACETDPYILVCVVSHVNNFEVRNKWRTFMKNVSLEDASSPALTLGYEMVFLVAEGSQNDSKKLQKEHFDHGDIVQVGFQEAYHKLVSKSLAMLDWFNHWCQRAQFLLKIDDDVFLNLPKLANIIQKAQEKERIISGENFLLGRYVMNRLTPRQKHSRWYIPETLYNKTLLPPFVNGAAYIMSKTAVHGIQSKCAKGPAILVEDIFLTGICRQKAGVKAVFDHRLCIFYDKLEYIPKMCATFHHYGEHLWSYMSHNRNQSITFDYEYNNGTGSS